MTGMYVKYEVKRVALRLSNKLFLHIVVAHAVSHVTKKHYFLKVQSSFCSPNNFSFIVEA